MKRKILSLLMATLILTSLSACKTSKTQVKNWTADLSADPVENLQVFIGQDQKPLSLNKDQEVEIMDQLSKLKKSESKDFFDSAYDDDTIVIKFSEDSYIELIESKPARKDGLYYYNYFKDGNFSALLRGEENIRENIRNIIER